MKYQGKLNYQIVHKEETPKSLHIKASFHDHYIELIYEMREIKGEYLWFGKIFIDGKLYWQTSESFGCDSRAILDDEIQHRLYTWALMQGYISHNKLAP
ncbi:MAG: hypothetical protein ACPMAG_13415 [Limisphaerales bacterium]|jgi:hypothetical protein